MALNRYITTSRVVLAAGTYTADVTTGLRFGTGSFAQQAGDYGSGGTIVIPARTVLLLDPAGAAFTAIGSGNLAAWNGAQDTAGIDGVSN